MNSHFEYKGYLGSAEVDVESGVLVGKLLFIRDTITYSAASVPELKEAFEAAVDDYLQTCQEMGDEPDIPCKGTFNVRVGPERHRKIALAARTRGMGLNDFVCFAIDAINARSTVQHIHKHEVVVMSEPRAIATTSHTAGWIGSTVFHSDPEVLHGGKH